MMKAHVIKNGVVVNTILVDSIDQQPDLVEAKEGSIGWLYENGEFIDPNIDNKINNDSKNADRVRNKRDRLLRDSDYTVLPDSPVADISLWKTYRQNLRDIPQQSGFPYEVIWPEKPAT